MPIPLSRICLVMALPLALIQCSAPSGQRQSGTCRVIERADLPIEAGSRRLLIPAQINNQPVKLEFRTDLGPALALTPAAMAQLKLPPEAPIVIGQQSLPQARIEALKVGDLPAQKLLAHIRPAEGLLPAGSSASGLLGLGAVQGLDIEIDPNARRLRFFEVRGCGDSLIPFAEAYGTLPLERGPQGQSFVFMSVDGAPIRTVISSGSDATLLSRAGAERAGARLPPAQAGAARLGVVPFQRLELGDLLMLQPRLLVLDAPLSADAVLGNDFLMRQRLWISPATGKVYVARQPAAP